jgi:hypothetical protein
MVRVVEVPSEEARRRGQKRRSFERAAEHRAGDVEPESQREAEHIVVERLDDLPDEDRPDEDRIVTAEQRVRALSKQADEVLEEATLALPAHPAKLVLELGVRPLVRRIAAKEHADRKLIGLVAAASERGEVPVQLKGPIA